jgi:diguanylate cyclase (GGDEF)-like protein
MNNHRAKGNRGNILVVDDTPYNLDLLCSVLTRKGFNVIVAESGQKALALVQVDPPELILLDICMPQMNGYEVCKTLKADPLTRDIPVIFISALDEILDKVKAFEVGGVDYITKPFHAAEVVVRVNLHLSLRLQQQLEEQNRLLKQEVRARLAAEAALKAANQELQRLAHLDGLTQVANRRGFDSCLAQEWRRMSREQQPLSLILCDVDFFKRYNDTYGHQAGDDCLCRIASAISTIISRPSDLVARYGGEEFVIILPNTPIQGAIHIAKEIQKGVRALELVHERSQVSDYVTLSIGITSVIPDADLSPMMLIAAADRALYKAKMDGRDRIGIEEVNLPSMQCPDSA